MEALILKPSPSHPITMVPLSNRATAVVAGKTVADSERAIVLREASYPPVIYFPREGVDMSLLEPSIERTYCPYKGSASYYSVPVGGDRSKNAVWSYEAPHESVSQIRNYLAFYPNRVDSVG